MSSNNGYAKAIWSIRSIVAIAFAVMPLGAFAETHIVKDGQPRAQIVISEHAPPLVTLAAQELQTYVGKMSGAKLAITQAPDPNMPVGIYVGKSPYTERFGVTSEGLKHGAYRMVSGENRLVLLGRDASFVPAELLRLARRRPGTEEWNRMEREWRKRTGEKWLLPYSQFWKQYHPVLQISEQDEWGSFNAVCGFLRMQGVRWYMPNTLGEIVPKRASIELPQVDKVVEPGFALRYPYQYGKRFRGASGEEILWQLRMGFNQAPDLIGAGYIAHGTALVIGHPEVKAAHPEFYALHGDRRLTDGKFQKHGKPCLSSTSLIEHNVRFVRAMYDIFDAPMVSVMPTDGFVSICQCELCKGKSQPERGWRGQNSNYVWSYVNRVAEEVYRTHPQRKVVAMAYSTYLLPPTNFEKLCPNIVVAIAQNRSIFQQDPATRKFYEDLRAAYVKLMPEGGKRLCIYDYYRYAVPGKPYQHMPVFFPHAVAADLRSLKDVSLGDYIEVYREREAGTLGVTHLNLYVTARFWWDAEQDVDALLEEYYSLFYGPAREEMKAFIEFSEKNWMDLRQDTGKIDRVFDLLGRAQNKVAADSVFGKRIALVADYIRPLQDLRKQLAKGRENVPVLRLIHRDAKDLRMDGKLDDKFWRNLPTCRLRELQTGRGPAFPSRFKAAWSGDSLYFGIQCLEQDGAGPRITATRTDDTNIWTGDCIEILLETQTHSYYQLAISPAGALVDLDRKGGLKMIWSSNAQIASHVGDGSWSLEVRIPLADANQEEIDALNGVAGRKPSETYPWYFNVCRQRMRPDHEEYSAFSPPGKSGFHHPMKFAKLYVK